MSSHECPATETKVCKDCGEVKPLSSFYPKAKRPDGSVRYFAQCKPCFGNRSAVSYEKRKDAKLKRCKEYREENSESITQYLRGWYERNRERVIERSKAYQARPDRKRADEIRHATRYQENRESIRAKQKARNATPEGKAKQQDRYKKHYAEKPTYYTAKSVSGSRKRRQAKPSWVRYEDLRPFYDKARYLTKATGIKHVVDHIVPLAGRNVCGLHVACNLQVIPEIDNLRKFNRFG